MVRSAWLHLFLESMYEAAKYVSFPHTMVCFLLSKLCFGVEPDGDLGF